jgi:tetrahydromethanopterin S-methyltransferase subunit G
VEITAPAHPPSAQWYTSDMNENHFEERLDRLEKTVTEGFARMEAGFAHVNGHIETLANTCAREFAAISEHFTQVDGRLDDIEAKIEIFGRRLDHETEQRQALGKRVSKLEQSV